MLPGNHAPDRERTVMTPHRPAVTHSALPRRALRAFAGMACAAALALPAAAFDIGAMTEDERAAFRDEVRAYLLENPEVLIEAIGVLEDRQAGVAAEEEGTLIAVNAEAIFEDDHSWVAGNPDGSVTLVMFSDYTCGFCRRAYPEVMDLLGLDDDVRFVLKEFPILGPNAEMASRLAIAVLQLDGPDRYAEVHDSLMTMRGSPDGPTLMRLGEDLGLDMEAVSARMDSAEVTRVIEENRALAARLQINGTPTFVLEDRMLRGFLPLAGLLAEIEDVRAQ